MIPIDKNISVPSRIGNAPIRKYPFQEMELNDSFFAPSAKPANFSTCARPYRPKKFITRTVTENGVKGTRVWRIA